MVSLLRLLRVVTWECIHFRYKERWIIMTREDWIEYFEAVNSRTPSEEEISQALADGEFQEGSQPAPAFPAAAQPTYVPTAYPYTQQTQAQTAQSQPAPVQVTRTLTQPQTQAQPRAIPLQQAAVNGGQTLPRVWQKGGNYFSWFAHCLKNPQGIAGESRPGAGLVTMVVSALLLGFAIVNALHRVVNSFFNGIEQLMRASISSSTADFSALNLLRSYLDQNMGWGQAFLYSLLVFVIYLVALVLPAGFNRLATKGQPQQEGFIDFCGRYLTLYPLMVIINLVALIVSFFVPSTLLLTTSSFGALTSVFSAPPQDWAKRMADAVPDLGGSLAAMSIIMTLIVIGFVWILVVFAKSSASSLRKVNNIYMTCFLMLLLILVAYLVARFVGGNLTSLFTGMSQVSKNF